jgi:hypothetical protein
MVEKNLQQIQLQKIQEQMREINKPRKRKTWPKNSKLCMGKKKIRIHGGLLRWLYLWVAVGFRWNSAAVLG